jgi:hypothetical protein
MLSDSSLTLKKVNQRIRIEHVFHMVSLVASRPMVFLISSAVGRSAHAPARPAIRSGHVADQIPSVQIQVWMVSV